MTVNQETLLAYVDGELEAAASAAIERAASTDATLAAEIERHRTLRSQLRASYASVLDEPVPERLQALLRPAASTSNVIDLAGRAAPPKSVRQWRLPLWTSLAASVVFGIFIGQLIANVSGPQDVIATRSLNAALSSQASGVTKSAVTIGLSYESKQGEYCRTFAINDAQPSAGFACRVNEAWQIRMLMPVAEISDNFRTASSAMPAALITAIDEHKKGDALDPETESALIESNWSRSKH